MKKYPVTFILPSLVFINQLWEFWRADCVNETCYKFIHWSGKAGFVDMWHYWIFFGMISNIGIIVSAFLLDRNNPIERDSLLAFLIWSILEVIAYLYNGWPSFKLKVEGAEMSATLFGYCLTLIVFITIRIFKDGDSS